MWVPRWWTSHVTMQGKGSRRSKSGNAFGGSDICSNPLMVSKIWQGEEGIICQRSKQRHKGRSGLAMVKKGSAQMFLSLLILEMCWRGWFSCTDTEILHKGSSSKGMFSYLQHRSQLIRKITKEEKEEHFYYTLKSMPMMLDHSEEFQPHLLNASQQNTQKWNNPATTVSKLISSWAFF